MDKIILNLGGFSLQLYLNFYEHYYFTLPFHLDFDEGLANKKRLQDPR